MPEEKVRCKFLSIIMLDSAIESDKKYYRRTFLENVNMYKKK